MWPREASSWVDPRRGRRRKAREKRSGGRLVGTGEESSAGRLEKRVRALKRRRSFWRSELLLSGEKLEHDHPSVSCDDHDDSNGAQRHQDGAETMVHKDRTVFSSSGARRDQRQHHHRNCSSLHHNASLFPTPRSRYCLYKNSSARNNNAGQATRKSACLLSILLATLVIFATHDLRSTLDGDGTSKSRGSDICWPIGGVQCANSSASQTSAAASNQQTQPSQTNVKHSSSGLATSKNSQRTKSTTPSVSSSGAKATTTTAKNVTNAKLAKANKTANSNGAAAAARHRPTNILTSDKVRQMHKNNNNNALKRTPQASDLNQDTAAASEAQISVTPRVSQIRVPVDSNAMLKCLISSSSSSVGKLIQKFDIHWSRFMYDESVYEQLETSPLVRSSAATEESSSTTANSSTGGLFIRQSEQVLMGKVPFNRQQQLRDFLARSRQETNVISDLLIEATLSISPVQASDNASYYCTATDGVSSDQNQARIDLVALSRPVVQLERVLPARDSKSAIIQWLVLSDGNTPIKKTILMVRNDTTGVSLNSRPLPPGLQESLPSTSSASSSGLDDYEAASTTSSYSSMVIDSNYNHWQRIEIPDERLDAEQQHQLESPLMSPYDRPATSSAGSIASVAAADVDVTSPLGSFSGQQQQQQPDQVQDYYTSRLRWNLIKSNKRRQRSYNLTSLLPGVTYNFRLAAINDMGQSEWTYLTATLPNEIPAQISEMFLLSRSNDSLAIGWRRPAYDGAKTVRYEMQLFDLNRTLTLDANTNTSVGSQKTNFMYIFVNLNPGTDYHFHVRACSLAGCSAFSSPKLLASTLDGEPDEPLEVELNCEPESGNVSVSWLPPVNPRGQLLNYTISFDSRARYRNQSGRWQVDEWRSSMETADNQTLSLEAGAILLPNTNYSVRVCANNRSKHCGRLSQLTSRAQCATPPELPGELPRFQLRRRSRPSEEDPATTTTVGESLQLELPFISARNGTLSCIQVVLIRLPDSFDGQSAGNLREFLPEHPDDVTLSRYAALQPPFGATAPTNNQFGGDKNRALAYLAEELDPSTSWFGDSQEDQQQVAAPTKVFLGDGRHGQCQMRQSEAIASPEVHDGPLKARAFYSGFVKLILVRPSHSKSRYFPAARKRSATVAAAPTAQEILTKYSGYFEPVRMGDNVLELTASKGSGVDMSNSDLEMSTPFGGGAGGLDGAYGKLRHLQELAAEWGSSVRRNFGKFYNLTSSRVAENLRLETLADFIRNSSPLMQLFEVGMIVIVISLTLLLIVYLITLPATISRRRRRKIKRQLQRHQQEIVQQQQQNVHDTSGQFNMGYLDKSGAANHFDPPIEPDSQAVLQQQHQHHEVPRGPAIEYQPIEQNQYSSPAAPTVEQHQAKIYGHAGSNCECPIHSSPLANNTADRPLAAQQHHHHEHRQAAVHVCQPMFVYGSNRRPETNGEQHQQQQQQHHHYHHHHNELRHHHHQQEQYERNCRTTRRSSQQFVSSAAAAAAGAANDMEAALAAKSCLTLGHQQQYQSSVLALAKKINKSIPLRLFRAVLECRLRNGWLKEEYEQLPNPLLATDPNHQKKLALADTQIKLRPQLIVSRNDSMSALISGNDQYDAGLISFVASSSSTTPTTAPAKRRIICAKSPLDADSVWDFWRLVYERDVSTIVMLTQNEDANTGELRCAQYWPTCDNEETTILSPCNEFVEKSSTPPAKFKIRQETLEEETLEDGFMVRRLTLMVMATKPGENDPQQTAADNSSANNDGAGDNTSLSEEKNNAPAELDGKTDENGDDDDDDDEKYVIVQRDILQLQFHCWNTSNLANQLKLISFIRRANERHLISLAKPLSDDGDETMISPQRNANNPMLVHCFNGLGRSGVFAGLSFILDELAGHRLRFNLMQQQQQQQQQNELQLQQATPKLNLFVLVSRMRLQRELTVSPYRFYELLYQLAANCIPSLQREVHIS